AVAYATHGFFDRQRIGLTDVIDERLRTMMERVTAAGLSFACWHAPSATGLPVLWCQVIEAQSPQPLLALPTEGHGAALTLEGAIFTALSEAVATRPAAISGAREDQTLPHYAVSPRSSIVARARA